MEIINETKKELILRLREKFMRAEQRRLDGEPMISLEEAERRLIEKEKIAESRGGLRWLEY